jgi:hypothetical protein
MTPNDVILTSFDPVSIAFLEYWVWSFILLIAAPCHMAADMANGKSVKLMITSFNKVFGTPLPDIWQYGSFFFSLGMPLRRGQFNHKFSLRSPPPLRPILGDMDPQWSNLPRCKKTLVNR